MLRKLFLVAALLLAPLAAQAQQNQTGRIDGASSDCADATANGCVTLTMNPNNGSAGVQISGTYSGTLQFEGSTNGTNFVAVNGVPPSSSTQVTSTTTTGIWQLATAGMTKVRVRASAPWTSGTANIFIQASQGTFSLAGATISATVATAGLATSANQTSGSALTQICDAGVECATVTGGKLDVNATLTQAAAFTALNFGSGTLAITGANSPGTAVTLSPVGIAGVDANGLARRLLLSPIGAVITDASGTAQAITAASASFASGAFTSGAFASGSYALGAFATGAFSANSIADGASVTLGLRGDNKSTATDSTAVSEISILKEISFMAQNPAAVAVTNAALVADIDDAAITAGQTTALNLALGYVYTGSAWVRPVGITQGATALTGNPAPFVGAIGYYSDTGQPIKSTDVALVLGNLASNGAAAATNRLPVLPAISRTNLPSAFTALRDVAMTVDNATSATWTTNLPAGLTTYVAVGSGTLASTPTDIATLSGNATNTVIVTGVEVTCTQTTSGINDIFLTKHSAADTGGASIAMTAIPLDSGNTAAVSAPLWYTANPTVGTTLGAVDRAKLAFLTTTTAAPADIYIWRPTMGQSVVLRGTAQQLGINLNGATTGGAACNVTFRWIETTGY